MVLGSWGSVRQKGKTKPGSRQITVKGNYKLLLQMCVAPESTFPTRVFSLSGKTSHILCCVYEKVYWKRAFPKTLRSVQIPGYHSSSYSFCDPNVSRIYHVDLERLCVM